jgi:signal transduction histidine kinase
MKIKQTTLAHFLMILSMILLGIFLAFYLYSSYKQEKEALAKEAGYLFISTIREIEEDLLTELMFQPEQGLEKIIKSKKRQFKLQTDSVQFIGVRTRDENVYAEWHDSVNIQINTLHKPQGLSDMTGSISLVIDMTSDSLGDNTHGIILDKPEFLPKLEKGFRHATEVAGLPVQYSIFVTSDSIQTSQATGLLAGSYTDIASGERYQAQLNGYNSFLFKKMLPEILFALCLFICIGLAFFTVFKSLKKQQRLTQLKNDFVQNISHELKTPIATVSVALEAMRDFSAMQNPVQMKEYLEISRLELKRLSLLTDKVLSLSKPEKGMQALENIPLDMRQLLEEVIHTMQLHLEKQNAVVETRISGSDFHTQGDPLHLTGVIYNLLDNALKYSGKEAKIQIDLEEDEKQISVAIKDNGPGIPDEFRNKLFERFFRVPSQDGHQVKGHGLGLSYAARIIDQHNGKIGQFNQDEGGSCFYFIIPKQHG